MHIKHYLLIAIIAALCLTSCGTLTDSQKAIVTAVGNRAGKDVVKLINLELDKGESKLGL